MSIKIMTWVWENAPYRSSGTRLVLLAIADWCDDDGLTSFGPKREEGAWIKLLSRRVLKQRRQTQRIVAHLERAGALERVASGVGRGNNPIWRVVMNDDPKGVSSDTFSAREKVSSADQKRCHPQTKKGVISDTSRSRNKESYIRKNIRPYSRARAKEPELTSSGEEEPNPEALRAFKARVAEFMQRHKYPSNAGDGARGLRVRPVQAADGSVFDMGERDGDASR